MHSQIIEILKSNKVLRILTLSFVFSFSLLSNTFANNWDATGLAASVTANAPYTATVTWTNPTHPSFSEVKVYRNGSLIATTVSTSLTDGGLQAGTTYTYKVVTCLIAQGCEPDGPTVSVTTGGGVSTPSTPTTPSTPAEDPTLFQVNNLVTSATSPTTVSVSWSPPVSTSGLASYRIFRNGAYITETSAISFSDSNLQAATKYFYTVVACYSGSGCQTSGPVSYIDTPAVSIPKTITNLSATAISDTSITLGWTPPSDASAQTEYKVYRNGSGLATTKSSSYSDSGLSPVTAYIYQVIRCTVGSSCLSDGPRLTVTTTKVPPKPPTGLTAQVFGVTVDLTWTASTDATAVNEYKVYRDGLLIGAVKTPAYSDSKLAPDKSYQYTVYACFADATCDPNGAQVTVTTDKAAATVGSSTAFDKPVEMVAKPSGSISSKTISAVFKIPTTSKPVCVFVAAVIPNVGAFFMDSQLKWTAFTTTATVPLYQMVSQTPVTLTIPVVTNLDLSSLIATQFYVGYGFGITTAACANEMLNTGTYSLLYTVSAN